MDIKEMYSNVRELLTEYPSDIYLAASEGQNSVKIGKREPHPQEILIEFDSDTEVDREQIELSFRRLVEGTEWNVTDDGFFSGDGVEIIVYRELQLEDAPPIEQDFKKSERV